MDPVSVFKALYDTKCLQFGQFYLKSGLVAPYYINLRRLSLYPELMDAVVTQIVEKFLTNRALIETTTDIKRHNARRLSEMIECQKKTQKQHQSNSEADSELEDEGEISDGCSSSVDDDWEKVVNQHLRPILCGVPYGAVPLAAAAAFKAKLPYLFEQTDDMDDHGDQECLMEGLRRASTTMITASNENNKQHDGHANKPRVVLIEDVICSGQSTLNTIRNIESKGFKVEFVICIVDLEENGVNLLLEQADVQVLTVYKVSAILRVLETTGRITSEQFIKTRQWMTMNQFQSIVANPSSAVGKCLPEQLAASEMANEASIKVAY